MLNLPLHPFARSYTHLAGLKPVDVSGQYPGACLDDALLTSGAPGFIHGKTGDVAERQKLAGCGRSRQGPTDPSEVTRNPKREWQDRRLRSKPTAVHRSTPRNNSRPMSIRHGTESEAPSHNITDRKVSVRIPVSSSSDSSRQAVPQRATRRVTT